MFLMLLFRHKAQLWKKALSSCCCSEEKGMVDFLGRDRGGSRSKNNQCHPHYSQRQMSFRDLRAASTRFVAQYSVHSNYFLSNKWRSDKEVANITHAIKAHTAPTEAPKALELMGVKPKESPASCTSNEGAHYGPHDTPSNIPTLSAFPTTDSIDDIEIVIDDDRLSPVKEARHYHIKPNKNNHIIPVSAPTTPRGKDGKRRRKPSISKRIGKISGAGNTLKLLPIRSISNPFENEHNEREYEEKKHDPSEYEEKREEMDDTLPSNKPQFIHHQSHSTTDLEKYQVTKRYKTKRGLSAPDENRFRFARDSHIILPSKKSKHQSKTSQSQCLLDMNGNSNHLKPISKGYGKDAANGSGSSLMMKVSSFMDKFRKSGIIVNTNKSPISGVITVPVPQTMPMPDRKTLVQENFADAEPFRISISGKDNQQYINDLMHIGIDLDLELEENLGSLSDPINTMGQSDMDRNRDRVNHRHSSSLSSNDKFNQNSKEICISAQSADDATESWISTRL